MIKNGRYGTCAAICCVLVAIWLKRRNEDRDLESHSITLEALHTLLDAGREVLLFDVRRPLDLLIGKHSGFHKNPSQGVF